MPRRSKSRTPRPHKISTSSDQKKRRLRWAGFGLLALVALVAGSFLYFGLTSNGVEIDKSSNCPATGPRSYTAVIIDATDSINAVQKVAIGNELSRVRSEIPRYGALAIYAAGFKGELSRPAFAYCNPGHADDINPLTEGTRLAEKKWKEGFEKPLDSVLQGMLSASESNNTPLLEAIQSVSVQSFGPIRTAENSSIPKRLIIVSDMLQNSENLSLYSGIPDVQDFLKTQAYRRIRSDLDDVKVTILMIRRQTKKSIQGSELIRFWEELIAGEGGRLVHFKPLEG